MWPITQLKCRWRRWRVQREIRRMEVIRQNKEMWEALDKATYAINEDRRRRQLMAKRMMDVRPAPKPVVEEPKREVLDDGAFGLAQMLPLLTLFNEPEAPKAEPIATPDPTPAFDGFGGGESGGAGASGGWDSASPDSGGSYDSGSNY